MARREPLLDGFLRSVLMRRLPAVVRYGYAVLIAAACFLLRLAVPYPGVPFLVFIPGLIVASLLFGRGPGLLATLLSAVFALLYLVEPRGSFALSLSQAVGVLIFIATGASIAVLCHTLRATLVNLIRAEREKALLLEELGHRTKNNLQMVVSLLKLQSRSLADPAAIEALQDAAGRVHVIAKLHARLQPGGPAGAVNMRDYLAELCGDLADTLRAIRPVAVTVGAEPIVVDPSMAAPIGLIVNELVTNCFKYAFPDGASGIVNVAFETAGNAYALTVRDNGIGASSDVKTGQGSRLTDLLVRQLQGRLTRGNGSPGMVTVVTIPRGELLPA